MRAYGAQGRAGGARRIAQEAQESPARTPDRGASVCAQELAAVPGVVPLAAALSLGAVAAFRIFRRFPRRCSVLRLDPNSILLLKLLGVYMRLQQTMPRHNPVHAGHIRCENALNKLATS